MPAANADKIDLYKLNKAEYAAPRKPKLIETKPAQYMVVEGRGAPGGEVFQARIEALYGMAYTAKFRSKFAGRDYTVCKLEGIYGIGGQSAADFARLPPEEWKWKLLIRVPDFVGDEQLDEARRTLRQRGKEGDFDDVHLEEIDEGRCVQMLHVGPYEEEQRTVEAMKALAEDEGYELHMWHHEIYLSDPRRVPPDRLKTILRHPVRKK
ncbi:MAG: GyrI-like domain-containing protein [Planctomycetota bacterium]|nr:GyrI-like domain-containing protein [Planctomycetota bacterium]